MKKETYLRLTKIVREHPRRIRLIAVCNQLLAGIFYVLYPLFLLLLLLRRHPFLLRAAFVPAVSFAAVSVFRSYLNVPRPYEKFGISPVLKKDTSGKSFPSRHVFSAFMLAMTVFYLYPLIGCLLFACGCLLAVIRVISGVHEPRDVIAGAVTGIICGAIGYYVL